MKFEDIPNEVINAAKTLTIFFAENNIKRWEMNECASREYVLQRDELLGALEEIMYNFVPRKAALDCEQAAIDRATAAITRAKGESS